ncbi:hypothetical protein ThvES_00018910 [Thiovulum sp. ES]|nr:hypothetical protein ThvES_00018910 [Thiovulum sp. ES]
MVLMANDVKKRGVSIFQEMLEKFDEVIISVRGKHRFAVIDIERYEKLRALELEEAYREVREDIENGDFETSSASNHIQKLKNEL